MMLLFPKKNAITYNKPVANCVIISALWPDVNYSDFYKSE